MTKTTMSRLSSAITVEEWWRWAVLVATIWIQAFTGTNFDFSAYSSNLKSVLGISQVQLNYLAVASDMGKALGWSSGLALLYFPLWSVLLAAAGMGLVGYLVQWLLLSGFVQLHYLSVFLLCLLSGCSICWFNTVCFILCTRSFPANRPLALSLSVSFNGVSAALYTLMANAVTSSSTDQPLYLLLNAIVPFIASLVALIPIFLQPFSPTSGSTHRCHETRIFLVLFCLAFLTGIYLLFLNSSSYDHFTARMLLGGAVLLLTVPLFVPHIISSGRGDDDYKDNDLELHKGLIFEANEQRKSMWSHGKDRLIVLGEEHSPRELVRRIDFWLYYVAYFCGATVGLVYSNNLGQITQSLGRESETSMLVSIYSACSFFGRLLSSSPDFLRGCSMRSSFLGAMRRVLIHSKIKKKKRRRMSFARTGWITMALMPMPLAFFLLADSSSGQILIVGTALVGLSSGFIFAAAVSITSELFGPNSIGLNHNILITNIPLGSLLYGLLAALVYDSNGNSGFVGALIGDGAVVCLGTECYAATFIAWGCITIVGLVSSTALFLRTKSAYERSELDCNVALLD